LKQNPKAVPHAYFYEMGRNYFTFGHRHSCFTTGFAVFMRYVCIDSLTLDDGDNRTRKVIDEAIDRFEKNDMDFIAGFTTFGGHGEKGDRLKDEQGKPIRPSDQNVLYASLLLKLRKEHGGNDWVKEFYTQIRTLPPVKAKDGTTALRQSLGMMIAASLAADKDLSPDFAERYKLALTPAQREAMSKVNWADPELTAGTVVEGLD
ncbi:MAG: calcium-binding protein, partial [Verrucomicrobiota bacterium]